MSLETASPGPNDKLGLRVTPDQVEGLLLVLVEAAAKWMLLLGQLGLTSGKVEQINRDTLHTRTHSIECLQAGLYSWVSTHQSPTYDLLCTALRSEVVGENVLAERLVEHVSKIPGRNNRGFHKTMSCDALRKWLLREGLDQDDCRQLQDKKVCGGAFTKLKRNDFESLGVSLGSTVRLEALIMELSIDHHLPAPPPQTMPPQALPPPALPHSRPTLQSTFPDKLKISGQKPTLYQLQLISWKGDKDTRVMELRIFRDAAPYWEILGSLLALSGPELESIRMRNMVDPAHCIRDVFSRWLLNGGQLENAASYPVTWRGLYNVLCDSELYELAQQLCEALEAKFSTLRKTQV